MNLTDIIALAKQGYKPSDIKELLTISGEGSNNEQNEPNVEGSNNEQNEPTVEGSNNEQNDQTEQNVDNSNIDYKSLYEESQKMLKEAQKANIKQNIQPDNIKSDQESLNDIIRRFM